ncbi:MAG: UDP-N-acetylglucosamine 4,6-dehydratase (inverting) [Alphaproteobacteria bacterium]|nr:UDP-N-acetylglucosamine 4,6-dehydratase (inverting) [Alphaproteobacteria bacterium]
MLRSFAHPAPLLDGASILVTGGTGSFGQKLVATLLARHNPKRIIVFSRDEQKHYDMAQTFKAADHPSLRFFIGDVRDKDRLEMAMREIDFVVHAAALKHVPAAEYNPFECIRTNVHGAENVVGAALRCGVKRVVALSTDKAVNPVNLYGASKLAADKIFVAANNLAGSLPTRFSVVRYGNVVGSRGSVVPLYKRLIAEGAKSLPVTDARMTRFWVTLQQGVDFVLASLAMMHGGEIFVPKLPSMTIVELARLMAPSLKQEVIGIRPGEKLHEALLTEDDARTSFALKDRFVVEPQFAFWKRERYDAADIESLPEGFRYTSDNNSEWLDETTFKKVLTEL